MASVPRIMPRPNVIRPPYYKFQSTVLRNAETWYHVRCYRIPIFEWIAEQPKEQWLRIHGRLDEAGYEIDGKQYVMDKEMYIMFKLRWA